MHPTQRAPHSSGLVAFSGDFWLKVGSGKMALSRPAHQRVTQAVRLLQVQEVML